MLAKVKSASVIGIDGFIVHVEVDLSSGLPVFSTVGLPDAAVRESKDRVVAAVRNSGFDFPSRRVTVNLSPADVKKEGTAFDLPIAIGVLAADGLLPLDPIGRHVLIGELALDGRLRPVRGILPIALAARDEGAALILPAANAAEASVVKGLTLVPAVSLEQTIHYFRGEWKPEPFVAPVRPSFVEPEGLDLADIRGQLFAKRALEVAAAGSHNLLMIGPPGSGKTMLARRLPGLLTSMTFDESLETRKIHSVAGLGSGAIFGERPFRSPHHTISDVALIGGGTHPRPGEVSLAHNGVLFLDELPEFDRHVLEVLRQPLEEGSVTVSRAAKTVCFPARFMLVAAMNPCPCGYEGHPERECVCTPMAVRKYRGKVSGPLLDRIDMHVEVPALSLAEITEEPPPSEKTGVVLSRILDARARQRARGVMSNSRLSGKEVKAHCKLDAPSKTLVKEAVSKLGLSARSFDRILKVARTVADLAGSDSLREEHVAEAVGYRSLDRPLIHSLL